MPGDPHSGSKVWEAPDREIGKPGENCGKVVAHRDLQPATVFHDRENRCNLKNHGSWGVPARYREHAYFRLYPSQVSKADPEEITAMRNHCEYRYRIIKRIRFLSDAAEIVYAHREHYDGSGYPRGLRAEQIPLGARIFAIADTLEALTSVRPYRQAIDDDRAREEI